jgi:hypothetical protein
MTIENINPEINNAAAEVAPEVVERDPTLALPAAQEPDSIQVTDYSEITNIIKDLVAKANGQAVSQKSIDAAVDKAAQNDTSFNKDSLKKEILEEMRKNQYIQEQNQRAYQTFENTVNQYLNNVDDTLADFGINSDDTPTDYKVLTEYIDGTFSRLVMREQQALRRNNLTPAEVARISKEHWAQIKPTLDSYGNKTSSAPATLSPLNQSTSQARPGRGQQIPTDIAPLMAKFKEKPDSLRPHEAYRLREYQRTGR